MSLFVNVEYWSHSSGIQAPSQIKFGEVASDILRITPEEVDDGEAFTISVNPELSAENEVQLEALIKVLDPEQGSETMDALHLLLESVFLAGIEFAEQSRKM
jgi:hypothetical protein